MYNQENYKNILNQAKEIIFMNENKARQLGAMESILVFEGKLKPGETFKKKTITYETRNIFLKKVTRTRTQTYSEVIIEMFEELVNEKSNLLR